MPDAQAEGAQDAGDAVVGVGDDGGDDPAPRGGVPEGAEGGEERDDVGVEGVAGAGGEAGEEGGDEAGGEGVGGGREEGLEGLGYDLWRGPVSKR